jgi:hypothetical protein
MGKVDVDELCHMSLVGATEYPLRFVLYGLRPSADALSIGVEWGCLGSNGVETGGGLRRNCVSPVLSMIAEIEKQGHKAQLAQKRATGKYSKRPRICMNSEEQSEIRLRAAKDRRNRRYRA